MEEKKKNQRKATILMIVGVITLIGLVVGATYAYFVAQVGTGDKASLNVKAGTTDDLSFSLSDLNATKDRVVDNDNSASIIINANQTNFAEGNANIADGITGTATLIAGDDDYKAEGTYNVYLNITKNELKYSSYIKKVPDETLENILSFKDEAKRAEADLSNYNPRPELYLTIKKNGAEVKTGVTVNDNTLKYNENVFTKDDTQLGGFDITETKGLVKIEVPATITVNGNAEDYTSIDAWEITVTFMNLDTDQNLNTGKSVIGNVMIQSEEYVLIQDKLLANSNKDGKITLYHHNVDDLTDPNMANKDKIAGDDSYRFSGSDADVKNYVCLDSKTTGDCESDEDLYRIIGLFKNNQDEYEMKLIKASAGTTTQLGDDETVTGGTFLHDNYYRWNTSSSLNMWRESNLNKVNLNKYYYDYIIKKAPYLQKHITEHTWITGGYENNNKDAKEIYDLELGEGKVKVGDTICYTQIYSGYYRIKSCTDEDLEYPAYIGLMYISDYLYGARPSSWTTTASNYNNVINSNWMYSGTDEWTITRESSDEDCDFALMISSDGSIIRYDVIDSDGHGIRPSFYLTSDAKISEGEGSKTKPYRISFE